MKLHEIDTLLALPYVAEITINDLDAFFIREVARYYGAEIYDCTFSVQTEIKRNDVTLLLYSKPKQL